MNRAIDLKCLCIEVMNEYPGILFRIHFDDTSRIQQNWLPSRAIKTDFAGMDPILTISQELCLRALKPHEADVLYALVDNNRPHLREWLPWVDAAVNPVDTRKFLEASQAAAERGASVNLGIRNKGELVGVIGFHGFDRLNRVTSLGYWLAAEHCGKGFMRAAVRRCMDFAFNDEGMNRLYIRCAVGNQPSEKIPRSLGFTYEGTQRQAEWLYTKYVDLKVYSMLASEWRQLRDAD